MRIVLYYPLKRKESDPQLPDRLAWKIADLPFLPPPGSIIFDGEKKAEYSPTDDPEVLEVYGRPDFSLIEGEAAITVRSFFPEKQLETFQRLLALGWLTPESGQTPPRGINKWIQ